MLSHCSCLQPKTYVKREATITVFELLMMGGVSPETCWTIKKHWNNKFSYTVASCCLFLWDSIVAVDNICLTFIRHQLQERYANTVYKLIKQRCNYIQRESVLAYKRTKLSFVFCCETEVGWRERGLHDVLFQMWDNQKGTVRKQVGYRGKIILCSMMKVMFSYSWTVQKLKRWRGRNLWTLSG
jgi:hypothetical protein